MLALTSAGTPWASPSLALMNPCLPQERPTPVGLRKAPPYPCLLWRPQPGRQACASIGHQGFSVAFAGSGISEESDRCFRWPPRDIQLSSGLQFSTRFRTFMGYKVKSSWYRQLMSSVHAGYLFWVFGDRGPGPGTQKLFKASSPKKRGGLDPQPQKSLFCRLEQLQPLTA